MDLHENPPHEDRATVTAPATRESWVKPEITSFKGIAAAQGISYNPGDGLDNLS